MHVCNAGLVFLHLLGMAHLQPRAGAKQHAYACVWQQGKVYDTMKYKRTAFNKIADIKERASTGGHPSNKEGTLSWAFVLAKATEGEIVV